MTHLVASLRQNQRASLKLSRPFGGTLLLALLFFAFLMAALELIARSSPVQSSVPFQAYGTNHVQFELQVQNLETFIAQHGPPDCFILGNSQSLRGIDPEVFAQVYQAQTGQEISCYNFGIVGTNISTTLYFGKILLRHYHPGLLIVGTNFLDYTESRENRVDPRFADNAWIDYQLGQPSLKGWLIEHSYAFRLLMLLSYGAPEGMNFESVSKELRKWNGQISAYGYGYSDKTIDPTDALTPAFIRNFLEQFGGFTLSRWNLSSLESLIQFAHGEGCQVVIVEMPYHPSLVELRERNGPVHPEGQQVQQFIQQVNQEIQAIADRNHTPYLSDAASVSIPEDGWHDRYHLNRLGSPIFTRWLAEGVAQISKSGLLPGLASPQ